MIATGTGIAPFWAFIHEWKESENILIFGCWTEKEDFYYKEEFKNVKLFPAFSWNQVKKVYV